MENAWQSFRRLKSSAFKKDQKSIKKRKLRIPEMNIRTVWKFIRAQPFHLNATGQCLSSEISLGHPVHSSCCFAPCSKHRRGDCKKGEQDDGVRQNDRAALAPHLYRAGPGKIWTALWCIMMHCDTMWHYMTPCDSMWHHVTPKTSWNCQGPMAAKKRNRANSTMRAVQNHIP